MPKTQASKRKRSIPTRGRPAQWQRSRPVPPPSAPCPACGGETVAGSLAAAAAAAPDELARAAARYWLSRGVPAWSEATWCRGCDEISASMPVAVLVP